MERSCTQLTITIAYSFGNIFVCWWKGSRQLKRDGAIAGYKFCGIYPLVAGA